MLAKTQKVDLHVHTCYSDGTFSPEDVVKEAEKMGLAAIAICDHDCIDGIEEAQAFSRKYGVEIIPGVEITSEKNNLEIHILGYFVDIKAMALTKMLEGLRESRVKRMYNMIEKLRNHGLDISSDAVFDLSGRGTVGRLHLAMALYNAGLLSSVKKAFANYIGDKGPCYVRRFNISPEEAIGCILESGGVPVCAHPKTMGRDDLIPGFIKAGLRGLEVYHTDHKKAASRHYLKMAQKMGLLATGGSDCHGMGKGRMLMGGVTMPYSTVEQLRRESEEIKKKNSRGQIPNDK